MSQKKDDSRTLEASIREAVREKLREALPQPTIHRTVEDHLNCPNCYPKFEKAMLDRGYRKPEPKRRNPLALDI